jgi:hypothetical protein
VSRFFCFFFSFLVCGFSRFGVHVLFARHGWTAFPPGDGVGMFGSPGVSVGVRWSYFGVG